MKTIVKSSLVAVMAALLLSGTAPAEAASKKQQPTFLDKLFSNSGSKPTKKRRTMFGIGCGLQKATENSRSIDHPL